MSLHRSFTRRRDGCRATEKEGIIMMRAVLCTMVATGLVAVTGCSSIRQSDVCIDKNWYGYHKAGGCPPVGKAAAPDVSGSVALASAARLAALEGDRQRLADELAAARQRNADLEAQLADREKELSAEMAQLKQAERGLVRALK